MGQDISFQGKWEASIKDNVLGMTTFSLQISKPENKILLPAQLEIKSDSFKAVYYLLLVKKNNRQLGISKNKFALNETPFSIGNWTIMLNGLLSFNKNSKGQSFLKLERIESSKFGFKLMETKGMTASREKTATSIFNMLQHSEIILYKTNNQAWDQIDNKTITQTKLSPTYFSIYDTLFVNDKEGQVIYNPNKDNDIISFVNNNETIADQIDSKKKRPEEYFSLDTGLNVVVLFADDFGSSSPSGASAKVSFDNISKTLDFNAPENLGATFIAQKIYRKYIPPKITTFQNYPTDNDVNLNRYPNKPKTIDSLTKRINKDLGGITTQTAKLTFSYWDNAVEDGDSISIIINDKWLARGLFVKNQVQELTVSLTPGPNFITFIADNLGSIAPNTSVIEIIDGDKRKSYFLQTDLNQNNMIKVFYDVQGK